ncbi:hypothetical protein OG455_07340 [Kitasatospora sp. NBC_01287]|uniref:Clp protease N-terminal domain-containing protein n=1 Tax=Kitasatospora sp. NBC_01287 TaxID=2903573 RepID=UPI00225229FB|nr:Clp protease N-terminal domain-containing protein [Kitasatospora sp. NBC_01287]MCX4745338.1 hypothetical protein [Kitasatospora sp. NBC_01287]
MVLAGDRRLPRRQPPGGAQEAFPTPPLPGRRVATFERFAAAARLAITEAQREAVELRHDRLAPEHLLLGLLHHPQDPSVAVLVEQGLDLPTARAAVVRLLGGGSAGVDGEALGHIGIDLTAVREAIEAGFGPGALDGPAERRPRGQETANRVRLDHRTKKVLELGLRAAAARRARTIEPGHLLVGLLQEAQLPPTREAREGLVTQMLTDHGLLPVAVYAKVLATLDA